jgi:hypothetical protein
VSKEKVPEFVPDIKNWLQSAPYMPSPEKPIYEADNFPSIPYWLRKHVLKGVASENGGEIPGGIWNQRADIIEERMEGLLNQRKQELKIKTVTRHAHDSEDDALKHDATAEFEDGLIVFIQMKSSGFGIVDGKKRIRDKYFPKTKDIDGKVKRWMTEHMLVLVNGSETRSDEEIINESFCPQVERIREWKAREKAA